MGLLLGFVQQKFFVVEEVLPLPVEGTETRVNAADEANEFIVDFCIAQEMIVADRKCIGWYHTHPGYRCWLSTVDIGTQRLYQQNQDPWVAIVVIAFRLTMLTLPRSD